MCTGFEIAALAAAVAGGTGSAVMANQQAKAQEGAQNQAAKAAAATAQQQEYANNKANAKTPDISAILQGNANAARGGLSSTMLTGPGGVQPGALSLGKNTLLGSS